MDVELLCEYAHRVLGLFVERFDLSQCDTHGDGLLRESDVEFFFEDFLDRVPPLQGLQDDFRTYYIFTAVRKVFFFLDPKRRLKVSLRRLLTSAVFREVRAIVLTSSVLPISILKLIGSVVQTLCMYTKIFISRY